MSYLLVYITNYMCYAAAGTVSHASMCCCSNNYYSVDTTGTAFSCGECLATEVSAVAYVNCTAIVASPYTVSGTPYRPLSNTQTEPNQLAISHATAATDTVDWGEILFEPAERQK